MRNKSAPESLGACLVSTHFSQICAVTSLGAGASEVVLSNGGTVLVDAADHDWLSQYKWHIHRGRKTDYALGWIKQAGVWKHWLMHRFILNAKKGLKIDHENRNGLDNRRKNLRVATNSQNQGNLTSQGSSGFKGVVYTPSKSKRKPWVAQITVAKKHLHLGLYATAQDAARAYDEAAKKYFGEFALTNSAIRGSIEVKVASL